MLIVLTWGSKSAAADGLWNPERGFRHEVLIGAEEGDAPIYRDNWPIARYKAEGVSMVQGYCYLHRYVDKKISDEKLIALQKDFDRARAEGVKYLLRFAYCNDYDQPAPTLQQVLSHITQLTPIVQNNIDVIYCVQIGWLGLWGEFHSDPNGLTTNNKAVASVTEATLRMLPESRSTMMRRMHYRDIAESNSPYVKKHIGRVGFFNDGTLANYTDGGTFLGSAKPLTEDEDSEFAKVNKESASIPVDGESFWAGYGVYTRMNPYTALERFYKHHYTTFNFTHTNGDFDGAGPIEAWKETRFTERMLKYFGLPCDDGYFVDCQNPTAYDYIRDHLGYRLELVSCSGSFVGHRYDGQVTIRNVGCSRPINPRPIYAVLYDEDGHVYEYPLNADARELTPWTDVTIPIQAVLPEGSRSESLWRVALWLPDGEESIRYRSEYAIALARGTEIIEIDGRRLNVLPSATGACSENIEWRYDYSTRTLVLTGAGAVPDFDGPSNTPWYGFRNHIERVILTDSITALGSHTLGCCPNILTLVCLPQTPPMLGVGALCSETSGMVIETFTPASYEGYLTGCTVRMPARMQEKYSYTGKPQHPVVQSDFEAKANTPTMATEMGTYTSSAMITVEIEGCSYTYEVPFNYTIGRALVYASTRDYSKAYGAANPKFYVNLSGGLDGDVVKDLVGEMPVAMCDADESSPVGDYAINVHGGTLINDSLYEFAYEPSVLTVKEARLVIQANNATRLMGESNPDFTFTSRGYVNGEDVSIFTSLPILVCEADESSAPGEYAIEPVGGEAPNYTLFYKSGTLTVTLPERISSEQDDYTEGVLYDVIGRIMVDDLSALNNGLYIRNGKKIIK